MRKHAFINTINGYTSAQLQQYHQAPAHHRRRMGSPSRAHAHFCHKFKCNSARPRSHSTPHTTCDRARAVDKYVYKVTDERASTHTHTHTQTLDARAPSAPSSRVVCDRKRCTHKIHLRLGARLAARPECPRTHISSRRPITPESAAPTTTGHDDVCVCV